MNDLWYRKLGFYSNPFSIKPAAFDNELVAYDMSFVYKKIENGEMVFLEGDYGSGKTTILKNIISRFRGKNKIIYYSFNASEDGFNLSQLLNGANSLLRRVAGFKIKNIIMLLDEVHTMKATDAKKLLKPYEDGTIKSVVFVSHDYGLTSFPEEYKKLLNGNIIKTINLTAQEAIALVKKRIGNLDLLSDKMIAKIFLLSDKNPRRLLEYCEDLSRYALEMGDNKVTDYHITEVLGKVIKERQKKRVVKKQEIVVEEKNVKPRKERKQRREESIVEEILTARPLVDEVIEISEKEEEIKPRVEKEETIIEIKEIPQKDLSKEKKFKINKLVKEDKKNSLGTIVENEEPKEEPKKEEP